MILLLFVACVVLSGVYSGLETGIYATSRLRLTLDAAAGSRPARKLQALMTDMPRLLTVLLVCNNLVNFGSSAAVQVLFDAWELQNAELIGTAVVTAVLFVFGESVPKDAFRRAEQGLLYPATPLLVGADALLGRLVLPISWVSKRVGGWMQRRAGLNPKAPGERELLLQAGLAEGFLTAFQQRVAEGVLRMRSLRAGDFARPVQAHPVARLGRAGVDAPPGTREHRALVLDETGERVAGWVPLAVLAVPGGFRPPTRRDLHPVVTLDAATELDRVYLALDRSNAPYALIAGPDGPRAIDSHQLRRLAVVRAEKVAPVVASPARVP